MSKIWCHVQTRQRGVCVPVCAWVEVSFSWDKYVQEMQRSAAWAWAGQTWDLPRSTAPGRGCLCLEMQSTAATWAELILIKVPEMLRAGCAPRHPGITQSLSVPCRASTSWAAPPACPIYNTGSKHLHPSLHPSATPPLQSFSAHLEVQPSVSNVDLMRR